MPDISIQDLGRQEQLTLRINGDAPTFRLKSEAIAAAALHELDATALDFLEIAAAVFHADGEIGRGGETRPGMGEDWRRNLRITIPVREPGIWNRPDVKEALTRIVGFLTDDHVEFHFTQRVEPEILEQFFDFASDGNALAAEEVILFSGGLDSFAGVLEALSTGSHNILLVSHRSAQKVHHRQDELAAWLSRQFPGRVRHVGEAATRIGSESRETTQRSRSLLFAAMGHAVAQSFGGKRLSFYENGIVSHNLPISDQVVGTMATRTTHPLTILLLNRLIGLISPQSTVISNPYEWLTKTEIVERVAQCGGQTMIGQAVSCTHVREQTRLKTHCGRCSQCLDRRFAILAAGQETHDPPESYTTDVLVGPRGDDTFKTLAIEWTRHALGLRGLGELDYLSRFGSELARIVQGHEPRPQADVFQQFVAMHRRHGASIHKVMSTSIAAQSDALADHRLEPTCLLRLWISDESDLSKEMEALEAKLPSAPVAVGPLAEHDIVLDPNGPWTARFSKVGKDEFVKIDGLARVKGKQAHVAHMLKDVYLEDVAGRLPAQNHRFVLLYTLPATDVSKDSGRQYVSRCHKILDNAYADIFGHRPPAPLLIESGGKAGYRLDPQTNVVDEPPRK